jgi:hypothetical protein
MPRNESDQDKSNDAIQSMKQNIEVMTQVYKSFYAISTGNIRDRWFWQPSISCELIVEKELIKFFLGVPAIFVETFEKLISSFYPGAVIEEVPQPMFLEAGKYLAGGYFMLTKDNVLPIRQYEYFEVDPMDSILAGYARVDTDEKLALQILVSPLSESRQKKMRKRVESIKEGGGGFFDFLSKMFRSGEDKKESKPSSDYSSQQIGDIEKKAEDEWFRVVIRSLATSPYPQRPMKMLDDLGRSFSQYNYIWLNSFSFLEDIYIEDFAKSFAQRLFTKFYFNRKHRPFRLKTQILNIKELASIYHFPHSRTNRNPRIVRQKFKIVPAPDDLSREGILLWHNLYGGVKKKSDLALWIDLDIFILSDRRVRENRLFYVPWWIKTWQTVMGLPL